MAVVNEFWTIMSRASTGTEDIFRRISEDVYKNNNVYTTEHNILVPDKDGAFMAHCTEQLLQLILQSSWKDEFLSLDPVNTYDKDILSFTENEYTAEHTSDMEAHVLNENTGIETDLYNQFYVSIDPSTSIATITQTNSVTSYNFTMTDNLSDKIPLDKHYLYLRLQGTLPADPFAIVIKYYKKFNRHITDITDMLETVEMKWFNENYNLSYHSTDFIIDKIAIAAINLYRLLRNG